LQGDGGVFGDFHNAIGSGWRIIRKKPCPGCALPV
jgi:hypothetical protein